MGPGVFSRALDGDRDAFDAILRSRGESLYRTALAILGHEADALDATQEALIAAWHGISDLRDPERFDAWLGRILINECRMTLRRRGRARVRELPMEDVAERPSPADETRTSSDAFDRAFAVLTVDQRAILVLHHHQGYGVRDIAIRLGIPAGTVKWRLFRARRVLEQALEGQRT